MNVFGYEVDSDDLSSLSEVTIQASPEELKRLSDFLLTCANAMEKDEQWEHEHFQDVTGTDSSDPDLIVVAP